MRMIWIEINRNRYVSNDNRYVWLMTSARLCEILWFDWDMGRQAEYLGNRMVMFL